MEHGGVMFNAEQRVEFRQKTRWNYVHTEQAGECCIYLIVTKVGQDVKLI